MPLGSTKSVCVAPLDTRSARGTLWVQDAHSIGFEVALDQWPDSCYIFLFGLNPATKYFIYILLVRRQAAQHLAERWTKRRLFHARIKEDTYER